MGASLELKTLIAFLFSLPLFAASVTVHNDSLYLLKADIYSKSKELLTTLEIPKDHSFQWVDGPYNSRDYTKGPYTVVFTCPNGDEYGVVSMIPENSTVYAQRATGRKRCAKESQPKPHRDFKDNQPHWKN